MKTLHPAATTDKPINCIAPVTELVRYLINNNGARLHALADGIVCLHPHAERGHSDTHIMFTVSYDTNKWKLANSAVPNKTGILRIEARYLHGPDDMVADNNPDSLISTLRGMLTPVEEGIEFFAHPKELEIRQVEPVPKRLVGN